MKLLFVIGALRVGGAEKSTVEMINRLDGRYDMDLMVFNDHYMPIVKDIKARVRILTVSGPGKLYFDSLKRSVSGLLKAKKTKLLIRRIVAPVRIHIYAKKRYPEQIIWENVRDYIDETEEIYDAAIACCQGLPTYYVIDKVRARCKIAWMRSDPALQVHDRAYNLRYYRQYDLINTVAERAAKSMADKYPETADKIAVFRDVIDERTVLDKSTLYSPGFDNAAVNICTVGRLCEAKGYFLAIDVCRKLIERGYGICWYIVGEGSLRANLAKAISENHLERNFILVGERDNPFPYMRSCDIYVQPSLWEGYPRTVIEARILCKPIVATDFAGVTEQIIDGVNGVICNKDADELCDAITDLIQHPEKRREYTECLRNEQDDYDIAGRFDAMMKDVMNRKACELI